MRLLAWPPLLLALVSGCEGYLLDPIGRAPPSLVDGGTPPDGGGGRPDEDAGRPEMPDAGPPTTDMCGDLRTVSYIVGGRGEPTAVPLRPGQILAIGQIPGCTATLIAPTWVLTATHCSTSEGASFCMGDDPSDPDTCVRISDVIHHPDYHARVQYDADITLLELEEDATVARPGVEPIPVMNTPLPAAMVGREVEASGYGQSESSGYGTRRFVDLEVNEIGDPFLTLYGQEEKGVCYGDSGGPVIALVDDGTVRVLADTSHIYGGAECRSYSNHVRTDVYIEWIEEHTGPTVIDGAPCGELDAVGRCFHGNPLFCGADDTLESQRCETGQTCGWDVRAAGFRCITGPDPCEGFDAVGGCDGQTAVWCVGGVVHRRDCAACMQNCVMDEGAGGFYCGEDPCMGLDYLGRCNGDVAEYCEDGEFKSRDCGASGQRCRWIDDETGYWCG